MKLGDMTLKRKMTLGSCVSLVFIVMLGAVAFMSTRSLLESGKMVNHTHEVIEEAMGLQGSAVDMETGMRGYLLAGKESFLGPYTEGYARFRERIDRLKITVGDNPAQLELLGEMEKSISDWRQNVTEPTIELRRQIGDAPTMDDMADLVGEERGKAYFDRFRSRIADFIGHEENRMDARREAAEDTALKGGDAVDRLNKTAKKVAFTHDVIRRALDLQAVVKDMETGVKDFLLSGDEAFLGSYEEGRKRFKNLLFETIVLVGDNPDQALLLKGLEKALGAWRAEVARPAIELRRQGNGAGDAAALVTGRVGKMYIARMGRQIGVFIEREEHALEARETSARETAEGIWGTLDELVEAAEKVNHTHTVIQNAMGIEAAAMGMETGMRGFLLAGKEAFLQPYREGQRIFEERVEKLRKTVTDDPAQVALMDEIRGIIDGWRKNVTESTVGLRTEIGDARTMNDMAGLVGEERGKVYFDKFRKQVGTFIEREQVLMTQRRDRAGKTADRARIAVVGGTGLIIAVSLIVSLFLSRIITRPVNRAVELADALADGDMTRRLSVDTKDEVGALSRALNRIAENLGEMLGEVSSGSGVLSESSRNLASVSSELVRGADETLARSDGVSGAAADLDGRMGSVAAVMEQAAGNINMVATATEEMTATIREIAENTEKARGISDSAVIRAETAAERMKELGGAARDIGAVTDTISEISEQTNLLALNATIEAARAGDAGKGFAVVAGEIKELAARTASATEEIRKMVAGVQDSTSAGITHIDGIREVIGDINEIIVLIAGAMGEQSATTGEIAQNIGQTSLGIGEVNENVALSSTLAGDITGSIAAVNGAARGMSGRSNEVNRHAEALSDLSGKLAEMVGRFKLPL